LRLHPRRQRVAPLGSEVNRIKRNPAFHRLHALK
jgi:hypothetical protein